ncbi:glycosyltransferase [Longimicrobium sp.]|uniref:glycosyltransferase n=1 Tax=Longimicrobium sp. TaxID=2029185 RepID=UPI002BA5FADF|nr:glycosyltransferase [Longimicrobium sp.]HSU14336.1 glycosyltransferase [Longimicrobium sp.]
MTVLTILDAASAALLAGTLIVALANLLSAPRLERAGEPRATPLVSILVPARDEAANLRAHLPLLLASDYPRLEVIVLDDGSGDDTAAVAQSFARGDARLRVVRGADLPPGWLGKCWACAQLAREARGDVLLFCDADVAAGPRAVARTVAAMERHDATVVTAIPRHRLETWAEAAVVPLVAQLPVAATLPLALVPRVPAPSLSMANGQWLAFKRDAYAWAGGHASVRGEVLEDVHLGRAAKRAGLRLVATVAASDLSVRMYSGWREVRAGFGKNLYALFGARPLPFVTGVCVVLLAAVYPWMAAVRGSTAALGLLGMLLAVRASGAILFRQRWTTVALHPLGVLLALGIAIDSYRTRGRITWRGRTVRVGAMERGGMKGKSQVLSPKS